MSAPRVEIIVSTNGIEAARYEVAPGEYVLGRLGDLEVPALHVSRRHARLIITDTDTIIEDIGSTNGTYLDGAQLDGPARLAPNQRLSMGAAIISIIREAPEPEAPVAELPPAQSPASSRSPNGESVSAVTMKAAPVEQPPVAPRVEDAPKRKLEFAKRVRAVAMFLWIGLCMCAGYVRKRRYIAHVVIVAVLVAGACAFGLRVLRDRKARSSEYSRLAVEAERTARRGDFDSAIALLLRAGGRGETRTRLLQLYLTGAKADIEHKNWGAAAIKLQEAMRIDGSNAEAARLMPFALGESRVTVETKFPAQLIEYFYTADFRRINVDGAPKSLDRGTLPARDLKLSEGTHYFEIQRNGKRWCSLPLDVSRGDRLRIVVPISEIPEGYEYIHEGEFIQGDDGTAQSDGAIGKRKRSVRGFFMRTTVVLNEEYARFQQSTDYERLIVEALRSDGSSLSDIAPGAKLASELVPFTDKAATANVPVRGLSYYEAAAFAAWAGGRLPTEEEWEKATRGIDGRNFSASNASPPYIPRWHLDTPSPATAQTSPYGCYAMTDTIWQWTSSRAEADGSRLTVKGGTIAGPTLDRKPSRRNPMDPRTRDKMVGLIICKDLPSK